MSFKGIVVVGWPQPVFVHIEDCLRDRAFSERIKALFEVSVDGKIKDV